VAETNAKQVEDLALIPVRAAVDAVHRVGLRDGPARFDLEPDPKLPRHRLQVINDLKPRLARIPINRRNAAQTLELLMLLEECTDLDDAVRGNLERKLAAIVGTGLNRSAKLRDESARDWVLLNGFRDHAEIFDLSSCATPTCGSSTLP